MASKRRATADDAAEEVASTALPGKKSAKQSPPGERPSAFAELMKPKPKHEVQHDVPVQRARFAGRDGLAAYTVDPASFPSSRVVYYNDKFVVINDGFPKATVHLLMLPRDPKIQALDPQEAFDDPTFLAECREEEKKVRAIVVSELRRKLGQHSLAERTRNEVMESDDPPEDLPAGRDWDSEVVSGTHANPSMNHLHVHVLSRDLESECLKKPNHYLSFTTDFFIPMSEYPLAKDDYRRTYGHFPEDMHCWRCGQSFGKKMARLKTHLAEEYEEWKAL